MSCLGNFSLEFGNLSQIPYPATAKTWPEAPPGFQGNEERMKAQKQSLLFF